VRDQGAPGGADLVGALAVHVGVPALDQRLGELVEPVEVIGGVVLVLAPLEAEPLRRVLDGVDVLLLLLDRVGVVEAQVADAAVLPGEAEVEADRLGVAEVQVAVRLGRKARDDALVLARGEVRLDDLADEIGARSRTIHHTAVL